MGTSVAGSTKKKAIVRRFDKEPLAGYVDPLSYQQAAGVELMSAQGNVSSIPYEEIKSVCFVREFDNREQDRRVFNTRPRMEGLWVSLEFRDGEVIEGVLANNLLQVEHVGLTVTPPDPYGNNQRIFVPRVSLRSVEVLGVVGSPIKRRKAKAAAKEQIGLFDE